MNNAVSYGLSVFLALAFHGVVIAMLMMNWEESHAIETTEIQPYYIEAVAVAENPHGTLLPATVDR